jgi:hypothetical protein
MQPILKKTAWLSLLMGAFLFACSTSAEKRLAHAEKISAPLDCRLSLVKVRAGQETSGTLILDVTNTFQDGSLRVEFQTPESIQLEEPAQKTVNQSLKRDQRISIQLPVRLTKNSSGTVVAKIRLLTANGAWVSNSARLEIGKGKKTPSLPVETFIREDGSELRIHRLPASASKGQP